MGQLERTLREAGLREYDVQLEVQNLQDELIARRYTDWCPHSGVGSWELQLCQLL